MEFQLFNFSCPFAITSLICCEISNAKMMHFWRHWLKLSKLVDECLRYCKPKQCLFQDTYSMTKRPNFRVHVSPGSADIRGGITNDHSIAYSLSNVSAKHYYNQLMCVEDIICNVSVIFWDTVRSLAYHRSN